MNKVIKIDEETTAEVKAVFKNYCLCDSCLGRLFTKIFLGFKNKNIGKALRNKINKKNGFSSLDCELCQGLSEEINTLTDLALKSLKEFEFDTFLVGCKVDEDILSFEKDVQDSIDSEDYESIKREIKRNIGKNIEKKTGKTVDFDNPDIMIKIDTSFYIVEMQIKPLYVYGRYKKFKRDIPQTRWFCRTCNGIGCKKCGYTGKLYPESVEELLSEKFLSVSEGKNESFHGCGREDIDALMLGNGRPFVLEIEKPKKRSLDLKTIKEEINSFCKGKVEVTNLSFVGSNEKARIKQSKFRKIYRVTFNAEDTINIEKLKKAILCLQDCKIEQRTPNRVAHRRADMVRERQIFNCRLKSVDDTIAVLEIEAESGTYIKELVSGDDGRTKPNISEMIKNPCTVKYLDVIEVKGE